MNNMKKADEKTEYAQNENYVTKENLSESKELCKYNAVVLNKVDNVAVTLCNLKSGDTAYYNVQGDNCSILVKQDIPVYHKFSLSHISKSNTVYKYGQSIGKATIDIDAGQHVHSHNLVSIREYIEY